MSRTAVLTDDQRHRRYSADGTWDKMLAALLTEAQKVRLIDRAVSVGSTINRARQHPTDFDRGITAVIPEPADQQGHRKRRAARGGDQDTGAAGLGHGPGFSGSGAAAPGGGAPAPRTSGSGRGCIHGSQLLWRWR